MDFLVVLSFDVGYELEDTEIANLLSCISSSNYCLLFL